MLLHKATLSLRTLRRHKRFAALAILSFGISIGLATTMYAVLDGILAPRVAMDAPDRLMSLWYYGDPQRHVPIAELNDAIRNGLTIHNGAAASVPEWDNVIEHDRDLREARVMSVTPNYFKVAGIHPIFGRVFDESDVNDDVSPVVLTERLWHEINPRQTSFSPFPVRINGEDRVVIGILAREADFPGSVSTAWQIASTSELAWMQLTLLRLKPGVTSADAETQLRLLERRLALRFGPTRPGQGFRLGSATKSPFRILRFHWAMIVAVIAVLLIACVNLANLQLARGIGRVRELATRAAIGASRRDLVMLLVTESAWLVAGGLLLATLLTWWGAHLINAYVPPAIAEYVTRAQLGWRTGVVAALVAVACLVATGLLPAIRIAGLELHDLLKKGAGTGVTRRARLEYGVLVVIEFGLAATVLTTTSVLAKAAAEVRLFEVAPAQRQLDVALVLVARASPSDVTTRREWSDRIVGRALAMDSVLSAATSIDASPQHNAVTTYRGSEPVSKSVPQWNYSIVSPDYLRTRGIAITQGRDFSTGEFAEPEVIVDQQTAAYLWPGSSPVGQQIKLDSAGYPGPWLRVIGVAQNDASRYFQTDRDILDAQQMRRAGIDRFDGRVYMLNAADSSVIGAGEPASRQQGLLRLSVRAKGNPLRTAMLLPREIQSLGRNVRVFNSRTGEDDSGVPVLRAKQDFVAGLFGIFAITALALAAFGLFAILAHAVAQRTREFGVRRAVGADDGHLRSLVMREGNLLALAGIVVGLLLTIYSTGLIRAFVFSDYDRYDSRLFAAAALVLWIVASAASYAPARRAMRISPVEALRHE